MNTKLKTDIMQISKTSTITTYEGKPVTVITVFSDIDIAMIEDANGEIFDVKNSLIRTIQI